MRFLGTLLVFAGYVFVYASVAAGGKFATEPWAALFADAYTGAQGTGGSQVGKVPGVFDTPTGPAPYRPPNYFDTPTGSAPFRPPPGIPVTP